MRLLLAYLKTNYAGSLNMQGFFRCRLVVGNNINVVYPSISGVLFHAIHEKSLVEIRNSLKWNNPAVILLRA